MTVYSAHAEARCAQRNISFADIAVVKQYGRKIYRTGIIFFFLGERDIPDELKCRDTYARLEGTILLFSLDGELITVYRNREGLPKIRKKAKYRFRRDERRYANVA